MRGKEHRDFVASGIDALVRRGGPLLLPHKHQPKTLLHIIHFLIE